MKVKVWLEKRNYGEYCLHFNEPKEDYTVQFDRAKKTVKGTFSKWLSKLNSNRGIATTYCTEILSIFGGEKKLATALGDKIQQGDLVEVTLTIDGPFAPQSFTEAVGDLKVAK